MQFQREATAGNGYCFAEQDAWGGGGEGLGGPGDPSSKTPSIGATYESSLLAVSPAANDSEVCCETDSNTAHLDISSGKYCKSPRLQLHRAKVERSQTSSTTG